MEELRNADSGDIIVVCGGVIPPGDYDMLYQSGVSAIFGPGTNIPDAATQVLDLLDKKS
jgi:methylmalonyl-CoA mutase